MSDGSTRDAELRSSLAGVTPEPDESTSRGCAEPLSPIESECPTPGAGLMGDSDYPDNVTPSLTTRCGCGVQDGLRTR